MALSTRNIVDQLESPPSEFEQLAGLMLDGTDPVDIEEIRAHLLDAVDVPGSCDADVELWLAGEDLPIEDLDLGPAPDAAAAFLIEHDLRTLVMLDRSVMSDILC